LSHAPQRTEKNCLNCGATVVGHFCHICGQENVVPKESFGSLVLHFFYDITHFDGKFFQSLKYLLFKPGFLSKEYVNGRRASHLNPVRMYVFTSAIFFLVFFMIVNPKDLVKVNSNNTLNNKARQDIIEELEKEYKKSGADTTILLKKIERLKDYKLPVSAAALDSLGKSNDSSKGAKSFEEYDSIQRTLNPAERDNWFLRGMAKKFTYNKELRENPLETVSQWTEIFLHKLPYLLFISLPIFALILKLLNVRRSKFYYADHAIFAIHHYVFSFIVLLSIFLLAVAARNPSFEWLTVIIVALCIIWPVHLFIAMLNFYKQGWLKTFAKFILLNILGFFSLLILFVVFLFFSILGN
jgi:hypothetical protein